MRGLVALCNVNKNFIEYYKYFEELINIPV